MAAETFSKEAEVLVESRSAFEAILRATRVRLQGRLPPRALGP